MIELLLAVIVIIFVLGMCVIIGGYAIGIYNTIVKAKNDWFGQWANIKTEYQKRLDLYFNMSKSVKSYKIFEKDTLVEITKQRSSLANLEKGDIKQFSKINSLLAGMKINIEAYPNLKSDSLFMKLMNSIDETEECILSARGELNAISRDYNTYIQTFPVSLFAGLFKATNLQYFKETEEANNKPEIDV